MIIQGFCWEKRASLISDAEDFEKEGGGVRVGHSSFPLRKQLGN